MTKAGNFFLAIFATMKLNLLYISIVVLLFSHHSLLAQTFGSNVAGVHTENVVATESEGFKPDVSVSLGTHFGSYGPGFNSIGTFIAPKVSMPVAKKLNLTVGMSYSTLSNSYGSGSFMGNGTDHYGSLFVSGSYQLNDKITVRGTGYKTFLLNPTNFNEDRPQMDFSNQGVVLDVNYKITEHFQINASFHYQERNYLNPYFHQPYGGFGSPDPFSPGIGGYGGFAPGF